MDFLLGLFIETGILNRDRRGGGQGLQQGQLWASEAVDLGVYHLQHTDHLLLDPHRDAEVRAGLQPALFTDLLDKSLVSLRVCHDDALTAAGHPPGDSLPRGEAPTEHQLTVGADRLAADQVTWAPGSVNCFGINQPYGPAGHTQQTARLIQNRAEHLVQVEDRAEGLHGSAEQFQFAVALSQALLGPPLLDDQALRFQGIPDPGQHLVHVKGLGDVGSCPLFQSLDRRFY